MNQTPNVHFMLEIHETVPTKQALNILNQILESPWSDEVYFIRFVIYLRKSSVVGDFIVVHTTYQNRGQNEQEMQTSLYSPDSLELVI